MSQQNESPVERIKKASQGLRGTLKESLTDEHTGAIREDDQSLVKFHGMYMQDDRDRREERAAKRLERLYSFMIRLRLPGGFLTAEQYEAMRPRSARLPRRKRKTARWIPCRRHPQRETGLDVGPSAAVHRRKRRLFEWSNRRCRAGISRAIGSELGKSRRNREFRCQPPRIRL